MHFYFPDAVQISGVVSDISRHLKLQFVLSRMPGIDMRDHFCMDPIRFCIDLYSLFHHESKWRLGQTLRFLPSVTFLTYQARLMVVVWRFAHSTSYFNQVIAVIRSLLLQGSWRHHIQRHWTESSEGGRHGSWESRQEHRHSFVLWRGQHYWGTEHD